MKSTPEIKSQLEAVRQGRAFEEPPSRVFEIAGADAGKWLNDLVTAGIHELEVGGSCESLLLDATGRIRSHVLVGRLEEASFILVQALDQPEPIGKLLSRYVLSAKVAVTDLSEDLVVLRVPLEREVPDAAWTFAQDSSRLTGVTKGNRDRMRTSLVGDLLEAPDGFEAARIAGGIPRFPTDFAETSVPAEAGWDARMVDAEKGCFLGQESVAKIRNLGRPPFLVVGLSTDAEVEVGDPVMLNEAQTGVVTSALSDTGDSRVIARVRYFADELPDLRAADGAAFRRNA